MKLQVCRAVDAGRRAARCRAASRCCPTRARVRDVVASLAEGVAGHVADAPAPAARAPSPSLQLDEPSLPAVLAGAVRSTSGLRSLDPVPAGDAEAVLRAVGRGGRRPRRGALLRGRPAGRAAAPRPGAARGLARPDRCVTPTTLDDELGEALEAGLALLAGLVPAVPAPGGRLSDAGGYRRAGTAALAPARAARRVTLARRSSSPPPAGWPGPTPAHARAALDLGRAAARALADDPEG